MANAERWAGGLSGPAYAIDDETAIRVVDGTVDVVSEGHWKLLTFTLGLRLRQCSGMSSELSPSYGYPPNTPLPQRR